MSTSSVVAKARRKLFQKRKRREDNQTNNNTDNQDRDNDSHEYVPLKKRRFELQTEILQRQKSIRSAKEEQEKLRREQRMAERMGGRDRRSLIDQHQELVSKGLDPSKKDSHVEETQLLATMQATEKEFITNEEYAKGIRYNNAMQTTWKAPAKYRSKSHEWCTLIREKYNIEIEVGDGGNPKQVPPPISKFKHMRFPPAILKGLRAKNIKYPTPIQMQALPSVLSGRDCIGIAYTGSGKTLVFALPMIMFALEEQLKMPLVFGEGPIGIIICPSRELASQTYENILHFLSFLEADGWPKLSCLLCMGGTDLRISSHHGYGGNENKDGIHLMVATPGRLKDCLEKKKFNFNLLKYWCLDEADRLMDIGFEDDIRDILSFCKHQVQKVFFSATMPQKVRDLACKSMVQPIIINVGRAGAANLDVIQEVEYVKDEAKIVYLLECLKKTPPPVLIFCSNQCDVDDVHEYLLLKGVAAVAIHAGKDMAERKNAIKSFQNQRDAESHHNVDVLVATDVASKGLDFPDIRHVINFDMPKEIEDYIHRIGRTGRCGKTGVATTFINVNVPEITLYDLLGLLIEAKQKIPPILQSLRRNAMVGTTNNDHGDDHGGDGDGDDGDQLDANNAFESAPDGSIGCHYCGGLGHRIMKCPKLAAARKGKNQGFVDDSMMLSGY
eukprot:CAMPEP_0197038110 /NCGR_PEP_ID=MMETSP1384-20130603/15127_1 /TAXON_ID=29189 /ORGANISM="Ammonia sp." /LENGTH=669 /DNA_ID=CAMNT_0042468503 /DNA_START=14 /DNA_END=2023 /DNA_ORIENTATION=+